MGLGADADVIGPGVENVTRRPVGVQAGLEQWREVAAVARAVADALHAGQGFERRCEVDGAGDGLHLRAGGDLAGPADEERRTDAAFVGGRLGAFHAPGPAMAVRAVVGEVDDDGVFLELEFLKLGEDATDVAVLVLDHGQGAPGLIKLLLVGLRGGLLDRLIFESRPVFFRSRPRRMRRGERHEAQEGLGLIPLDELQGFVREDVDDVAFGRLHDAVVLERGVEVFAPMAGGVAPEGIEAAGERVIRPLAAVVPLAE